MNDRLIDQAADVFAGELVRIDKLGCNRRLIFALPCIEGPADYKSVQIKLFIPADYLPTLAHLLAGDGMTTDGHPNVALIEPESDARN